MDHTYSYIWKRLDPNKALNSMKFFIHSEKASLYLLQLNAFGKDPLSRASKQLDSWASTGLATQDAVS